MPAGNIVAPKFCGLGAGMTSEQSIRLSMSWPSVAIAVKMNWKSSWSFVWLSAGRRGRSARRRGEEDEEQGYVLTKDCHSHAVRESRARLESD